MVTSYMFQRESKQGPFIEFNTSFDEIMADFQHVMYKHKFSQLPLHCCNGKGVELVGVGLWKSKEAIFADCRSKNRTVYCHLDAWGNLDPIERLRR